MQEMFDGYYTYLCNTGSMGVQFLVKETEMLEKAKGVGLPSCLQSLKDSAAGWILLAVPHCSNTQGVAGSIPSSAITSFSSSCYCPHCFFSRLCSF
jgi:hypothetical protein